MDAIDQLTQDVREGRIGAEGLIELIAGLCRKLDAARKRIEELENRLGATPPAKLDESFSTRAEEKRQEARGKKKRRRKPKGRRGQSVPTTKSGKPSEPNPSSPKASLPTRVRCRMFGPCVPGERSSGAGCIPDLSRPGQPLWPNPRAGPQRVRSGDRHRDRLFGLCRRPVVRQSLCSPRFLPEAAAQVAGQRVALSVVARVGTVRGRDNRCEFRDS